MEQSGGCPHITEEVCQGHSANKKMGMQDSGAKAFSVSWVGKTWVESNGSIENESAKQREER